MGHYDEQYEAELRRAEAAQERWREEAEGIARHQRMEAIEDLNDALRHLRSAGNTREHSIAITHIETAIRWLR